MGDLLNSEKSSIFVAQFTFIRTRSNRENNIYFNNKVKQT